MLDVQDGKALLISRYALDSKDYSTDTKYSSSITWETSTLRSWLNGSFASAAFTTSELAAIVDTQLENADNPDYSTEGGSDTVDKVFCLSIDEANAYFTSDADRMCGLTAYAKDRTVWDDSYTVDGLMAGHWWLRSPGKSMSYAASVSFDGSVDCSGSSVWNGSHNTLAIRPAIWVNL